MKLQPLDDRMSKGDCESPLFGRGVCVGVILIIHPSFSALELATITGGNMPSQVSSIPIEVSPELAKDMLNRYPYKHQRGVRKWAVDFYASEMNRGEFKSFTTIELCHCIDRKYLIDGQHRLWAVVQSGKPQQFILLETQAANEGELAARYAVTDRGVGRTTMDQLATSFDIDGYYGFSKSSTLVNALGSAVMYIEGKFISSRNRGVNLTDKVALMNEYAPFAEHYFELLDDCTGKMPSDLRPRFNRQATMSVALMTFRFSSVRYGIEKIDAFWSGVATDNALVSHDPRKFANKHLLTVGMLGGSMSKVRDVVQSPAMSARYLANCFNAFVGDESRWKKNGGYYPTYPTEAMRIAGWNDKKAK